MKAIITIIFLMSGICSQAQLSTNQFKQVTGMIKTASDKLVIEINALKAGRSIDSVRIKSLMDSVTVLRKSMPSYLVLYVDTLSGLKFKQDTLYIKK